MLNLSEWHHDWYVRNRKHNPMWRAVNAQRAKDWRERNPARVKKYRQDHWKSDTESRRLRRLRKRVEKKMAA